MKKYEDLTTKEIKVINFNESIYDTVNGKMSVAAMIKTYGSPKGVLNFAKVEVLYPSTACRTIVVDRFVDGELHFSKDIVIQKVSKEIVTELSDGIATEFVRHPTYNGLKMPKATKGEIKKYMTE